MSVILDLELSQGVKKVRGDENNLWHWVTTRYRSTNSKKTSVQANYKNADGRQHREMYAMLVENVLKVIY